MRGVHRSRWINLCISRVCCALITIFQLDMTAFGKISAISRYAKNRREHALPAFLPVSPVAAASSIEMHCMEIAF